MADKSEFHVAAMAYKFFMKSQCSESGKGWSSAAIQSTKGAACIQNHMKLHVNECTSNVGNIKFKVLRWLYMSDCVYACTKAVVVVSFSELELFSRAEFETGDEIADEGS